MATRKDANRAAWDAAAKSTTESTLGLLIDTRQTVTNGVNVKSLVPKRGDAVLADADNNVIFVARDSYKALPSTGERFSSPVLQQLKSGATSISTS